MTTFDVYANKWVQNIFRRGVNSLLKQLHQCITLQIARFEMENN